MKTPWWTNLDSKENFEFVIVQCALPYCTTDLPIIPTVVQITGNLALI